MRQSATPPSARPAGPADLALSAQTETQTHLKRMNPLCVVHVGTFHMLEAALPSRCRPGGLQQEWTEPKWLPGNPDRSLLPSPGPKPWNTWRTQTSSRQADNLFLNPISVLTSQKQVWLFPHTKDLDFSRVVVLNTLQVFRWTGSYSLELHDVAVLVEPGDDGHVNEGLWLCGDRERS